MRHAPALRPPGGTRSRTLFARRSPRDRPLRTSGALRWPTHEPSLHAGTAHQLPEPRGRAAVGRGVPFPHPARAGRIRDRHDVRIIRQAVGKSLPGQLGIFAGDARRRVWMRRARSRVIDRGTSLVPSPVERSHAHGAANAHSAGNATGGRRASTDVTRGTRHPRRCGSAACCRAHPCDPRAHAPHPDSPNPSRRPRRCLSGAARDDSLPCRTARTGDDPG